MKQSEYQYLLWDWNGTLLDDVEAALFSINRMLESRRLPILDLERYREIFGFPVIDCYRTLGFQFSTHEEWDQISREFHAHYFHYSATAKLAPGVRIALEHAHQCQIPMSVLSASELSALHRMLNTHGIAHYFEHICGHSDLYGNSKLELGRSLLTRLSIPPGQVLLIGDTTHDFEVARDLGVQARLYIHGHQNESRLRACGCSILENFDELFAP